MDLSKLHNKLIAAARNNPPGNQVPYAFEKRVMANLARPVVDAWQVWGLALWRSAASCVVAMLLIGGWSALEKREAEDLSYSFEATVLAAADNFEEDAP